jgi:hypothetical protein
VKDRDFEKAIVKLHEKLGLIEAEYASVPAFLLEPQPHQKMGHNLEVGIPSFSEIRGIGSHKRQEHIGILEDDRSK